MRLYISSVQTSQIKSSQSNTTVKSDSLGVTLMMSLKCTFMTVLWTDAVLDAVYIYYLFLWGETSLLPKAVRKT